MSDELIPPAVRALIAERIDSVPELEAVLLFRAQPGRTWTPEQAGQRLYVSTTVAAHLLTELSERGFFAREGEIYRYAPESPELAAVVEELANAYSRHLVAVTLLIHSKPSQSVRDFANAFRLRRPKP
jgi:hypothetical protein